VNRSCAPGIRVPRIIALLVPRESIRRCVEASSGASSRLAVSAAQAARLDDQAHAARALWNLLHEWWTMIRGRSGRWRLPTPRYGRPAMTSTGWRCCRAQAAQAVLKTYFQAWRQLLGGPRRRAEVQGAVAVGDAVDVRRGGI